MVEWTLLVLTAWVAFANGANDNFKGVATLHGSGTLPYRQALAWATLATLAGSLCGLVLGGSLVARFSGRELVADAVLRDPIFLMAVAAGAGGTVLLATLLGFPISTTHALTGGLLGAAQVLAGPGQVSLRTLGSAFALPLLLSPLLAAVLAAFLYALARRAAGALGVTEQTCICVGGVEQLATYVPGSGTVRLATGLTVAVDSLERCERRYAGRVLGIEVQSVVNCLHVLSAAAVSFARGLNDTPKIVGLLLASALVGVRGATLLVALAIAVGGLVAARRVARTMAFRITGMNHGQGFSANLVTAVLVTLASPLGLPVSTTHVSCGALFGIGTVTGEARWRTILQILSAWIVTLPAAAIVAALCAQAGAIWR